ncbi:putative hydrolase of the HAD superfamily [Dietzia sp. 2505]|uniref:HAD family hydrolase n=1 Tax=Dietzia sp. 2505 TaxID=3156457 RepID=UPI00339B08F3
MTWALVFDLDDTLVEEAEFQDSAACAVARYLESFGCHPNLVASAMNAADPPGSPRRYQQVLNHLAAHHPSITDVSVDNLVRVHRQHPPQLSFRPDVLPMLETLRTIDVRLGIITDGPEITQRNKLKAVDASKYFQSIVITDELGPNRTHWKPDPKPFQIACKQLDVPPERTVYVGDNPAKDFYISATLPITTVRLVRQKGTHHGNSYLNEVAEHHSVGTLTEIPDLLRLIGAQEK